MEHAESTPTTPFLSKRAPLLVRIAANLHALYAGLVLLGTAWTVVHYATAGGLEDAFGETPFPMAYATAMFFFMIAFGVGHAMAGRWMMLAQRRGLWAGAIFSALTLSAGFAALALQRMDLWTIAVHIAFPALSILAIIRHDDAFIH